MSAFWSKRTRLWPWLAGVIVAGLLVLVLALSDGTTTPESTLNGLSGEALADAKVRAEIRKLEHDQQPRADVLPIVGAGVAVLGVIATLLGLLAQRAKEARDRADELDNARRERIAESTRRDEEREKVRLERADELERRQEERFYTLGRLLASDAARERVSALVAIDLLANVSADYRARLFVMLGSVLTVDRFEPSDRALARALVTLLRRRLHEDSLVIKGVELRNVELRDVDLAGLVLDGLVADGMNISGAQLHGASLAGARLGGADLSSCMGRVVLDGADLSGARLDQAALRRSSLRAVNLRRARLDAAKLDKCDCRGASLDGAAVTSVHFRGADLSGAGFRHANVKEAIFHGAVFDDDALRSMLKARNLQRKSFDDAAAADLQRVNGGVDPFPVSTG